MSKITQKRKSKSKDIKREEKLRQAGFLADYIETATVGSTSDKFAKYFYRKLKKKIIMEANNFKRTLDVYASSAYNDDEKIILHKLMPKNKG